MPSPTRPQPKLASSSPPSIWSAFATQARWKNWVLLAQLGLLALMTQVCFALARTEPDVVVVDEKGEGHFVERTASSAALLRFLDTERRRPTDLTLLAFTERFVRLTMGVNSATADEAWAEALTLMAPPLAEKMAAEARAQNLVGALRLAQVRTVVRFDDVQLVERRGDKAHVRALVSRQRFRLANGEPLGPDEAQVVDLVILEVSRSRQRPDGLSVFEWHTGGRGDAAPAPSGDEQDPTTSSRRSP